MPLEQVRLAYEKGTMALTRRRLDQLSPIDAAIVLQVLPAHPATLPARSRLAAQMQKLSTPQWIRNGALGEVFAAHTALFVYSPTTCSNTTLALLIERLLLAESAVGGPYRQGVVVDASANAHIAAFARTVAKPLPRVEQYVKSNRRALSMLAFVALKGRPLPTRRGLLYTALAVLANPGAADVRLVALCKAQHKDNLWHGEPGVILTSAVVLAALAAYQEYMAAAAEQNARLDVAECARQALCAHAPEPLRSQLLASATRVCSSGSGREIMLLPLFFAPADKRKTSCRLGAANVCGWIAYTIYDDIIDGDAVASRMLPVANVTMRASMSLLTEYLPHPYVARVFSAMDAASAWELQHCRFAVQGGTIHVGALPRYRTGSVLAARSFAHALGPLAFAESRHAAHTAAAFRHYLISRQLHDDLSDWRHDLSRGHISFVVVALLRAMRVRPGDYVLSELMTRAEHLFKRRIAADVCRLIMRHTQTARRQLSRSVGVPPGMDTLLGTLEAAAQRSLGSLAQSS